MHAERPRTGSARPDLASALLTPFPPHSEGIVQNMGTDGVDTV